MTGTGKALSHPPLQLRQREPDSPSAAARRILASLGQLKRTWTYDGEFPTEDLLRAWALDPFPMVFADTAWVANPANSRRPSNGVSDSLLAGVPALRAARARGLGAARITDGYRPLVRATAAEIIVAVWRELLAVAADVGMEEVYDSALAALFPDAGPIPYWLGVDADRFGELTWDAVNGIFGGLSSADTAAARLARDEAWQDAALGRPLPCPRIRGYSHFGAGR